jgi:predicted acyltransferase
MAKVMGSLWKVEVSGEMVPVQSVIYREIFRSWLPPHDASLAFALCFVLLWWLLLEPLRRRGIIVKV